MRAPRAGRTAPLPALELAPFGGGFARVEHRVPPCACQGACKIILTLPYPLAGGEGEWRAYPEQQAGAYRRAPLTRQTLLLVAVQTSQLWMVR